MAKGIGKKLKSRILGKEDPLDLHDPAVTEELFRLELGKDYKKYWDNLARTKQLAYFAVAGLTFGELPDDRNIEEHGKQTAEIIAKKIDKSGAKLCRKQSVGMNRLRRKTIYKSLRSGHS